MSQQHRSNGSVHGLPRQDARYSETSSPKKPERSKSRSRPKTPRDRHAYQHEPSTAREPSEVAGLAATVKAQGAQIQQLTQGMQLFLAQIQATQQQPQHGHQVQGVGQGQFEDATGYRQNSRSLQSGSHSDRIHHRQEVQQAHHHDVMQPQSENVRHLGMVNEVQGHPDNEVQSRRKRPFAQAHTEAPIGSHSDHRSGPHTREGAHHAVIDNFASPPKRRRHSIVHHAQDQSHIQEDEIPSEYDHSYDPGDRSRRCSSGAHYVEERRVTFSTSSMSRSPTAEPGHHTDSKREVVSERHRESRSISPTPLRMPNNLAATMKNLASTKRTVFHMEQKIQSRSLHEEVRELKKRSYFHRLGIDIADDHAHYRAPVAMMVPPVKHQVATDPRRRLQEARAKVAAGAQKPDNRVDEQDTMSSPATSPRSSDSTEERSDSPQHHVSAEQHNGRVRLQEQTTALSPLRENRTVKDDSPRSSPESLFDPSTRGSTADVSSRQSEVGIFPLLPATSSGQSHTERPSIDHQGARAEHDTASHISSSSAPPRPSSEQLDSEPLFVSVEEPESRQSSPTPRLRCESQDPQLDSSPPDTNVSSTKQSHVPAEVSTKTKTQKAKSKSKECPLLDPTPRSRQLFAAFEGIFSKLSAPRTSNSAGLPENRRSEAPATTPPAPTPPSYAPSEWSERAESLFGDAESEAHGGDASVELSRNVAPVAVMVDPRAQTPASYAGSEWSERAESLFGGLTPTPEHRDADAETYRSVAPVAVMVVPEAPNSPNGVTLPSHADKERPMVIVASGAESVQGPSPSAIPVVGNIHSIRDEHSPTFMLERPPVSLNIDEAPPNQQVSADTVHTPDLHSTYTSPRPSTSGERRSRYASEDADIDSDVEMPNVHEEQAAANSAVVFVPQVVHASQHPHSGKKLPTRPAAHSHALAQLDTTNNTTSHIDSLASRPPLPNPQTQLTSAPMLQMPNAPSSPAAITPNALYTIRRKAYARTSSPSSSPWFTTTRHASYTSLSAANEATCKEYMASWQGSRTPGRQNTALSPGEESSLSISCPDGMMEVEWWDGEGWNIVAVHAIASASNTGTAAQRSLNLPVPTMPEFLYDVHRITRRRRTSQLSILAPKPSITTTKKPATATTEESRSPSPSGCSPRGRRSPSPIPQFELYSPSQSPNPTPMPCAGPSTATGPAATRPNERTDRPMAEFTSEGKDEEEPYTEDHSTSSTLYTSVTAANREAARWYLEILGGARDEGRIEKGHVEANMTEFERQYGPLKSTKGCGEGEGGGEEKGKRKAEEELFKEEWIGVLKGERVEVEVWVEKRDLSLGG